MVKKHITRDYSAHKKSVVRPMDEYIKLEIFSYNHINTELYSAYQNNLSMENANQITQYAWIGYESTDKTNRFNINYNYTATKNNEYRMDIIYLNKDDKDMTGSVKIQKDNNIIKDETIVFDGEVDILKRQTLFYDLKEGLYNITVRMPVNTIFLGAIVREIKTYTGDNIDSAGTNLMFTQATVSKTSETKPAEVTCTVGYDDDFECRESSSGFYIDYHDEMNLYTKDEDGNIKQIFGGYVSSILPDNDRTKLTITGADRLIDGQNKYVLNEMFILGGTTNHEEYLGEDYKDFQRYGSALKYLCDLFENTLKNNINENYLVGGESYANAVTCIYGEEGNIKNVKSNNLSLNTNKNFITVRNNSTSEDMQVVYLYDYKDFVSDPIDITDYHNFFFTYGLGDPKTETDVSSSTESGTGASTDSVATKETITVNHMPSCACCYGTPYKRYTKTWKNYCPNCGKSGTLTDNPKGVYEGEITCSMKKGGCDADYCGYCGGDKAGRGKCKRVKLTPADGASTTSSATKSEPTLTVEQVMSKARGFRYGGNASSISISDARTLEKNLFAHDYVEQNKQCDCFGMTAYLFIEFMRAGYRVRAIEYYSASAGSGTHRTVQIWQNGGWVDPSYAGYDGRFPPIRNKQNLEEIIVSDGLSADGSTGTVTKIVNGYDKDNIFKGFFQIRYKVVNNKNESFQSYIVLDFSQQSNHPFAYGNNDKGFDPICLNNSIKQATINCNQYIKDDCYTKGFTDAYASGLKIYLESIKLKSLSTTEKGINAPYYEMDNGTIDNASCKLDIYACGFNNGTLINPTDLSSCGKSINTEIEELIKASGYLINMEYSKHRKDDVINFMVDNQTKAKYLAEEGDNNNILSWSSINYTPVSTLFNNSIYVFKNQTKDGAFYKYVNSKMSGSVLKYGEQTSLQTTSQILSAKEAYFYSRVKNNKFNWKPTYTYTISVVGSPDLDIYDLVQVKADAQKLNTVKRVQSIKISYSNSQIPRIRTELGLGEMAQEFQLQKLLRELRETAKQESTLFSGSASQVTDKNVYQWER